MQLARLKKFIPEEEAEQATPERVFRVKNLIALASHDTGNTGFGVAAPCVVNGDRPARAQQLGAKPCSAAVELASIEVAGEYELIVASRIVDHAAKKFFRALSVACSIHEAHQAFVAFS